MFIDRIELYTLWGKDVYQVIFNDGSFVVGSHTENELRANHNADSAFSAVDDNTFATMTFNITGAPTFYYVVTRFHESFGNDETEIQALFTDDTERAYSIIRSIFDDFVSSEWRNYWETRHAYETTKADEGAE